MPTDAANFDTAISAVSALIVSITANPKPTYQVGGKQVQWAEYLQMLIAQLGTLRLERQRADGPFEVRSRGI